MVSDGQTMPKTRTGTSASRAGHAGSFHVDFFGSSRNLGEEQLGGASADAQSYWQGRFAACTFVGGFLGVERPKNSWGVAQPPTRELRPLTLFLRPSLSAFPQLYAFAAFFPYSQIGSCPNVGTTCVQKTSCANTTVAVLSHGWNAIRPSRFTSWSKTS